MSVRLPHWVYKAQKRVLLLGYQKSRSWLFTGPNLDNMLEVAVKYAKWVLKADKTSGDLMVVQEKSVKVAHIRKVHNFLNLTGNSSNQKIVIISHFEIMTAGATNALLKVLEEEKQAATLILITRYSQQTTSTVRSRCFHLHFPPLKEDMEMDKLIVQYRSLLEESIEEEKNFPSTMGTLDQDLRKQFQMVQKFSEASPKDLLFFTFNRIVKFHHGILEKETFPGERTLLKKLGQSAIFWHNRWMQISEALSASEELYVEKKHLLRIALTTKEI